MQGTYVALLAAFVDICIMTGSAFWAASLISSRSKILGVLLIPYLMWVVVICVFQTQLVWLNMKSVFVVLH